MRLKFFISIFLTLCMAQVIGQTVHLGSSNLNLKNGLWLESINTLQGETHRLPSTQPFFTFEIDDTEAETSNLKCKVSADSVVFSGDEISGSLRFSEAERGYLFTLRLKNTSQRLIKIGNVVPLGRGNDRVYITGGGGYEWPYYLNRSRLYRPGYGPIGVVLPDNAWHLGFCDLKIAPNLSLTGLARRAAINGGKFNRWQAELEPNGEVLYKLWFDFHAGNWQDGLKMMFQERWLYDLKNFDNSLFERADLAWIRKAWIMLLQFAWDQNYYDSQSGRYSYSDYMNYFDRLTGGYDIFTLWPTWPRLGLDPRNQFDLYYDLPGGIDEIRKQADLAHQRGKRYFISYNPWDASTRHEEHMKGLARLLRDTDADGVVLDTRGESSRELQETADAVKPGIIMYSEGMAIPRHMPGIISGRVHDALYMPPVLNLNKFIKPDFAIFRVLQLADGDLTREIGISFFNGYAVEINTMRPGRPDRMESELRYLGRTTKILRENQSVFFNYNYFPMVETRVDSIYVNKWKTDEKIIYTIFSLRPEGFNGPLFVFDEMQAINPSIAEEPYHFVSLYNHEEIKPVRHEGKWWLPVKTEAFPRVDLGTRREGRVDCIAVLPRLLEVSLKNDSLTFGSAFGDRITITAGNPVYGARSYDFDINKQTLSLLKTFGRYEGKIVVQLYAGDELMDERILEIAPGTPRLLTTENTSRKFKETPKGMVRISGGKYAFAARRAVGTQEPFIHYPDHSDTIYLNISDYYIDKYPVTNAQFKAFLEASHYIPEDTTNFLKHWKNGKIPTGLENHPVVYVSYEDALAYARWKGVRLPTEWEWQYAAQGNTSYVWPWGNEFDSLRCNSGLNYTTPVDAYPAGDSPFGVADLVGNVWQMTADLYDDGAYYFVILKGGSHFKPTGSEWYVEGGPQPVYHRQILIKVSPSFDRSSTVGFRCAADFAP
ncbi:MAG: SUMF1/EgtB/PvdO family nonheme iron enzyme [Bacteroidota bacterium]